jgi:hypothetical protein
MLSIEFQFFAFFALWQFTLGNEMKNARLWILLKGETPQKRARWWHWCFHWLSRDTRKRRWFLNMGREVVQPSPEHV